MLYCDIECRGTLLKSLLHLTLNQSHARSLRLSKKTNKKTTTEYLLRKAVIEPLGLRVSDQKKNADMLIKGFLIRGSEKYRSSRILLMTTQPELWTPFVRNLFCTSLHQLYLIFIQTNCTFLPYNSFPYLPYSPCCELLLHWLSFLGQIHLNSS